MDYASTDLSLAAHFSWVKEGADHLTLVIFTKESMASYKTIIVVNLHL